MVQVMGFEAPSQISSRHIFAPNPHPCSHSLLPPGLGHTLVLKYFLHSCFKFHLIVYRMRVFCAQAQKTETSQFICEPGSGALRLKAAEGIFKHANYASH